MKLLSKPTIIKKPLIVNFNIKESGWYILSISARVKSEKQRGIDFTDDEDLRVEVDGRKFTKLNNPKKYFNSPAAFSGGKLHNALKTVYFVIHLGSGKHIIDLIPDEQGLVERIEVHKLDMFPNVFLDLNQQAEDRDRRPWITFTLVGLALTSIRITARVKKRYRDSDDLKIIIDGKTQTHFETEDKKPRDLLPLEWFYRLWYFVGSILLDKTRTVYFKTNLTKGLHYIELYADRMPTLESLEFNFSEKPQTSTGRPNADSPKWTGNFDDDSEEMILARAVFGEAEDQSRETKIWVAGSILNRVKAKAWPNSIHKTILQPQQYDPFKPSDPNYPKVIDPLKNASKARIDSWRESYATARDILSGQIKNPTEATHFHGRGVSKEWFLDNIVPQGRFIRQIDDTYFYWSPN